jgi:hypothetical protein
VFLVAGFYPTFGGVIARPAFAVGGMTFLQGQSALLAALLGAAAAALIYGLVLGLAVILARLRISLGRHSTARAIVSLLALWLGAVVLIEAQRRALGSLGGWPVRPLEGMAALKLAFGVGLGLLPHALVVQWHRVSRRQDQAVSVSSSAPPGGAAP